MQGSTRAALTLGRGQGLQVFESRLDCDLLIIQYGVFWGLFLVYSRQSTYATLGLRATS
jgi:hypothetical protein